MFLHAAEGLAMAVLVGIFTGADHKIFFVIFGALAALFPDIDFFLYLRRHNWKIDQFTHEHRDILHYPLQVSLIGGIFFWFLLGLNFSILWIMAILIHFIHDTIFEGWGVRWIPFDSRYFTLTNYSPKRIIKNKEEQRKIAARYGDPEWFKKQTHINKKAICEFVSFLFASIFALCWVLF